MGRLIKQPNGKFCKADSYGRVDFINYTEKDIINMYIKQAKVDMSQAEHFGMLIERIANGYNL